MLTTRTTGRRQVARMSMLPLVLMLSVACGSTVQTTKGAAASGVGGAAALGETGLTEGGTAGQDGLGPSSAGGDAGLGSAGGSVAPLGGGAALPGTAGGSPAGVGGTPAVGGGAGQPEAAAGQGSKVPGVENGFIKIGMIRTKNTTAAYNAIGAGALAGSGINDQMKQALLDHINGSGGVRGLKLKIVHYEIDQTDASTSGSVHQQRACAAWTEDDRVFAAVAGEGPVLDACLTKAGVLEVCDFCVVSTYDDTAMGQVPLLYSPNGVLLSRQVDFYVKGLAKADYFSGEVPGVPGPPKMGFLAMDNPVAKRQFARLDAELKAVTGGTFAEKGFLNNTDQAQFTGQLQNFLLQFKAAGVNRILVFDSAGTISGFGMQAADKNGYTPRWGFNSTSGAAILHNSGLVPDSQLPGLTQVGWLPAVDIGLQPGQGAVRPPGLDACLAIMKKAGLTVSSDTDQGIAGRYCDALLYFRDAMNAAPGFSAEQFGAGASSLGDRWKSSLTYGSFSGPSRRDMGSTYRTVQYNGGCNCFKYVGPFERM